MIAILYFVCQILVSLLAKRQACAAGEPHIYWLTTVVARVICTLNACGCEFATNIAYNKRAACLPD